MAKIDLQKGSGKQSKIRERSVKSQGILKWIVATLDVTSQQLLTRFQRNFMATFSIKISLCQGLEQYANNGFILNFI